ncbi:acetylornithine aminotransferase [Clostridia bacterium]|nr:acetylornithine aminotransferase [Clostridia bacterium]
MNFTDILQKDKEFVMQTYSRFPLAIERGEGARLYDFDGREYIDFTSGIGVSSIGYANPAWLDAVASQAADLAHTSNLFYHKPGTLLAERLCGLAGMSDVFFANSGAEANEGAIKLARKYSFDKYGAGRHTILTLENSFHGRTITTLAATGQERFHTSFMPFTEGFRHVPAGDLEALEREMKDGVCAVMLECIQGEGGVVPLEYDYLRGAFKLCKSRDILLIIDEVQTGIGRTGNMFAFQGAGIYPDVVTAAKGLGGGLPIGAVLANEACAGVLNAGTHATTFGANPICCAGALAVLDIVSKQLQNIAEKGGYIRAAIKALELPYVVDVRGRGLMIGVKVEGAKPAELVSEFIGAGLLCLTAGTDVIRLMPPLTITYKEIDDGLTIMQSVLTKRGK